MDAYSNAFAVLIGINENRVADWALPGVKKDVSRVKEILIHPERCGYAPENVEVLLGAESTRTGILDALDRLNKKIASATDESTTAVVYYSGHGFRDNSGASPEYYLIPFDVTQTSLTSRAIRASDFSDAIAALNPSRLLVLFDCCHAGGLGSKGLSGFVEWAIPANVFMPAGKSVSADEGTKALDMLTDGNGRAVLSSSRSDQLSYLRKDGSMSIFTYHLIEGLLGHAQPAGGSPEVLVSDLMSHVHRKVPESARTDWNRDQTPDYQISGNFPVALVLGGKGLGAGQCAPDPLEELPTVSVATQIGQARDVVTQTIVGSTIHGPVSGRDQSFGGQDTAAKSAATAAPAHIAVTPEQPRPWQSAKSGTPDQLAEEKVGTPDQPVSAEPAPPEDGSVSREVIEETMQGVLNAITNAMPADFSGAAYDSLFDLATELALGDVADAKRLEDLVAKLLRAAPAAEARLREVFSRPEFRRLKPASLV